MQNIKVCYPRGINGVVAAISLGVVLVCLDALFLGHVAQQAPRGGLWVAMGIFGFTAIWCGKTAIAPSLVMVLDHQGVTVGRGILFNKTKLIPWSKVEKIEAGELEWESMNSGSHRRAPKMLPAVRVVFSRDVSLGAYGFDQAMPEHGHTFVVSAKLMGLSQQQAVSRCQQMQKTYGAS